MRAGGPLTTMSLLGLCAGLAVLVGWELEQPPPSPTALASVEVAPPAQTTAQARIDFQPLEHYDAIVRRPLFNDTRAPIDNAGSDDSARVALSGDERELEGLMLTGVIISTDKLIALIRDVRAGTVHRVAPGAPLGEWRLERVDAESVTLRNEETERTLTLYKRDKTSAGATPRARAPGRPQQSRLQQLQQQSREQ